MAAYLDMPRTDDSMETASPASLEDLNASSEYVRPGVRAKRTTRLKRGLSKLLQLVFGYTILSSCSSLFQLLLVYMILSRCFPILESFLEQGIAALTAKLSATLLSTSGEEMAGIHKHTEMIKQQVSSCHSAHYPHADEEPDIDDLVENKFHQGHTVGIRLFIKKGPTPFHRDVSEAGPATANIFKYGELGKRHIRLLKRCVGPGCNSMIFKIVCLPLDEAFGEFVAVSYCWGTEGPSKWLPLSDGKYIHVTANVESLLTHIFHSGPESIWLDAMCINQSDKMEKTRQVQMMKEIYASARRTSVWLGHFSPDIDVLMGTSESSGSECDLDSSSEDTNSDVEPDSRASMSKTPVNTRVDKEGSTGEQDPLYLDFRGEESDAETPQGVDHDGNDEDQTFFQYFLHHLYKEAHTGKGMETELFLHGCQKLRGVSSSLWWQRVWVVQEVASSRSIQFHYGKLTFSIGFLYNLFKVIHDRQANWLFQGWDADDLPRGVVTPRINKQMSIAILNKLSVSVKLDPESLPLGRLYTWLPTHEATDPRDRIFALLNLANPNSYGRCIIPDYDSDTRDVFVHAMAAITSNTPDFTCLGFAGLAFPRANYYGFSDKRDIDLPSWVPDFAANTPFTNFSDKVGFYNASTTRQPILASKQAICRSHSNQEDGYDKYQHGVPCPLRSKKKQRCSSEHYETLTVYSALIDTVAECGLKFPQFPGAWRTSKSGLHYLDDAISMIHKLGTYPTSEKSEEILARTLYANNAGSSMEPATPNRQFEVTFKNFLKALRAEASTGKGDEELHKLPTLDRLGAYRSALPPTLAGCGRKLFSTRRGCLGLAFNGVQVGDEVRLINSTSVPFITRRCSVEIDSGVGSVVRELVCEAYIHGIMDGEASAFDNVEEGLLSLV